MAHEKASRCARRMHDLLPLVSQGLLTEEEVQTLPTCDAGNCGRIRQTRPFLEENMVLDILDFVF